jgi:hypothetical protein
MKQAKQNRISVEFDEAHLGVLTAALETYSRLQSGQIGMALDEVYSDRGLTWEEKAYIERAVRYIAFPVEPRREYDGRGGFYDQYDNEYDERGNIAVEGPMWKSYKKRPHLNQQNEAFGVGCPEMKMGTIAFEIKKVIEQYVHYKQNNGYRHITNVAGDGVRGRGYSGIPVPQVVGFEPKLTFLIPKRNQAQVEKMFQDDKAWDKLWKYIRETAFKKKPLPAGKCHRLQKVENQWYVTVEEPYII